MLVDKFRCLLRMTEKASSSKHERNYLRTDDPEFPEKIRALLFSNDFDSDDTEETESEDEENPSTRYLCHQVVDSLDYEQEPLNLKKNSTIKEELYYSDDSHEDSTFSLSEGNSSSHSEEEEIDEGESTEGEYTNTVPVSFIGKNGMEWNSSQPFVNTKTPAHNIVKVKIPPGLSNFAKENLGQAPSESEVWRKLFDDTILNEILKWTNHYLSRQITQLGVNARSHHKELSKNELLAFFGSIMLKAILKSSKESNQSLYRIDMIGRPIFRAIMSRQRFLTIQQALRFDDPSDRVQRKETDPLAPISYIFSCLVQNSQKLYNLSEYCTIGEMLLPFKGHCKFRIYMPKNAAKYGIKLVNLVDARTSYFYNSYIYTGKGDVGKTLSANEKQLQKPTQSLLRLVKPIYGSNRNITGGNLFSSIEAVLELQKKKLTYVGTLRRNKKEIPPEFIQTKKRNIGDVLYGFSNNITLMSKKVSPNRVVNIVSSMHYGIANDKESGTPEMIIFYNKTKGCFGALDFCSSVCNSQSKSLSWPICILFGMINISLVNAFVIHKYFLNSDLKPPFDFIHKLALQLITPHLEYRLKHPLIKKNVKCIIEKILNTGCGKISLINKKGDNVATPEKKLPRESRKYCSLCPYIKKRKTVFICIECEEPICLECSRKICLTCNKKKRWL